jgi:lipoprotein-anchoring transpeptidase ErfK/SrfK
MPWQSWGFEFPRLNGGLMIRRFGIFLLTLPVAALAFLAPASAQYYSPPPPGYVRVPPPGAYYDRAPGPAFWADDDDDDQPVRGRRVQQYSQNPPGAPSRILPYPDEAEATPPAPPAFAQQSANPPPTYGHQLDQMAPAAAPQRAATPNDPNVIRPPGQIGSAPGSAPAATPAAPAGTAALPPEDQPEQGQPAELPANLKRQLVDYQTKEPAGTIVVDTAHTYLYLILGNGKALRYGVRVGREGFTWTGTERISKMKDWPDWFPPPEMIERQPYLPRVMAGGPGNPLGARAMYLGHTLYRIHGTNQPSTIGHYVSSGCVGMLNEDVEDLYDRVQVGTRVVVLPGPPPETVANTGNAPAEPANPMAPPSHAQGNPPANAAGNPPKGAAVSSSPLPPVR